MTAELHELFGFGKKKRVLPLSGHHILVRHGTNGPEPVRQISTGRPIVFSSSERAAAMATHFSNRFNRWSNEKTRFTVMPHEHMPPKWNDAVHPKGFGPNRVVPEKKRGRNPKAAAAIDRARSRTKRRGFIGRMLFGEQMSTRPEAPPRTGPRKGVNRREYDRIRNHWKQQVTGKVIDEVSGHDK